MSMPATPDVSVPEIFDVTIRDGSYVIDFQFEREDVRLLCSALERAGFRYIEVGHGLGLNASSAKGAAAASDADYLGAAVQSRRHARYGAFFIPGIGQREHMARARNEFGIDFIRIGNDPEKAEAIWPFVAYGRELGLEVMCNFMKSYAVSPACLGALAAQAYKHGAQVIYVVDSAGGMLPNEVSDYVRAIADHCPARIGFHGHNNLELAITNSLSAWDAGATLIDCSIGGLGRSAGNTRTELFLPVLRALGHSLEYDFIEVLNIWQTLIQPLQQRRQSSPVDIASGYARIHSGLLGPFLDTARRSGVSIVELLCAYGDAQRGGADPALDELAHRLAARPARRRRAVSRPGPAWPLLQIKADVSDPHTLRNTLHGAEEVVQAAAALAKKACRPVAMLVQIDAALGDDGGVLAEYLYHDEHFIVLRGWFASVRSFSAFSQRCAGRIDVLAFERASPPIRQELQLRKERWHHGESVLWLDLEAHRHHLLVSLLEQCAAEHGANEVLLFGGDPIRLGHFLTPSLEARRFWSATPSRRSLGDVGLLLLERQAAAWGLRHADAPDRFDLALLLAPISRGELQAVLGRLHERGLVIDCLGQLAQHEDLLRAVARDALTVDLRRGLSGMMLNLLAVGAEHIDRAAWTAAPEDREGGGSEARAA